MKNNTLNSYRSVSHEFKITAVVMLFILALASLASSYYFPNIEIIPDKILIIVILVVVFYLWVQELIDFQKIIKVHKNLSQAHKQLKEAEVDTIAALIKTVEAKDLYTRGHSEKVQEIALAIAEEMNMDDDEKKIISQAAILHDIGKIGLNDSLLNKKEALTEEEREIIKKHPENAIAILESLKFLNSEKDIILEHHEHYDGKGYPKGLGGQKIRLEALIISVADTFDAMNSMRAYRHSLSKEAIISELKKSSGTQHSPEIIKIFLGMLEKNPKLWER